MRWWRRRNREQDLERELRSDLELEAEEFRERGLPPEEAERAARRAFGNVVLTKEEVRGMWRWSHWQILMRDLRYATRTLRKSPGYAATAILTLALGIGASTAVFTVVDSVILKPLTYRDSGSLVVAWQRPRFLGFEPTGANVRHVDAWRKRATGFSGITIMRNMSMGLTADGNSSEHPRLVGVVPSFANLFEVLQVRALLGRTFVEADGVKGRENVAVLSYPLWQSLFHGDAKAIGQKIRLDDSPFEVIGVLPANFHFPNANALRPSRSKQPVSGAPEPAVFFPVVFDLSQMEWNGGVGNWVAMGRLKPAVKPRQAEAQLNAIEEQIRQELPASQGDNRPGSTLTSVQPMREAVVGDSRTGLVFLMGAVAGLMLIACLNLANAQLGRALSRERESAVRAALGAAKWRLVWNSLAETSMLSLIGGAAGILFAYVGLDLFRRYSPVDLPRLAEVRINVTALLFSLIVAVLASVISGLLPALRMISTDPQAALQNSNHRTAGSRQSNWVRSWLIGLQVFGCTALLLVTGLFSKSLLHLLRQDKGFQTGQLMVAEVKLAPRTYSTPESRAAFEDAVIANLREIPGVQSAGLVSGMPLEGESWIESVQRLDRPNLETPLINFRWVSPGYFEATGQRLVAGRFLEERDGVVKGVVLSESEARSVWGSESPIGGRVRIEGRTFTVVGVVADSRNTSLKTPPARMAYVHYQDRPPYSNYFLVRSNASPGALAASMRQAIWKYAPNVTIARVKMLDDQVADSLSTERFQTMVLISFGAAALLLAMLGIYGVLSYSVVTRKQEIGVRMALGASRGSVYGLTLAEAGAPVFAGLLTGLGASLLAGRVVQKLLYGVQVMDLPVILAVSGLFLCAACVAAMLPARRAASLDPMDALRSD